MKVLIVEDDRLLAEYVRLAMKEDGHAVDVAPSGDEGQTLAMMHDYDVVVLDHNLPERTGLEILQHMRQRGKTTPVLMLTGRDSEADVVQALDSGADDYLRRPFVIGELRARIRALGRRRTGVESTALALGNLTLDRLTRSASSGDRHIPLTPKEFALLEALMLRPGRIAAAGAARRRGPRSDRAAGSDGRPRGTSPDSCRPLSGGRPPDPGSAEGRPGPRGREGTGTHRPQVEGIGRRIPCDGCDGGGGGAGSHGGVR
jgi:two-component system, OmpR family, response regulator QseB